MKRLFVYGALCALGSLGLQTVSTGHGGTWRGPGDTVPPGSGGDAGGHGPTTPGPSGPTTPGGPPASSPGGSAPIPGTGGSTGTGSTTPGTGADTPDLTDWRFWWEFNKNPYLNLKAKIHSGGVQSWGDVIFLGEGMEEQGRDILKPSPETIRTLIVPALVHSLETESSNDIVTGAMVALAKIGDRESTEGVSAFAQLFRARLADSNQEIAETAAVALGILANDSPDHVALLESLLTDGEAGRKAVGSTEVSWRTRSFAAYGLGLLGARTESVETRRLVANILRKQLDSDDSRQRDIKVGCLVSLGLVPLELMSPEAAVDAAVEMSKPAELVSRSDQVAYLLSVLSDSMGRRYEVQVRAHVPTALARLLNAGATRASEVDVDPLKPLVTEAILAACGRFSKQKQEVVQSCVLALGQLGDCDSDPADQAIRKALVRLYADGDLQSRNFSLISAAQVGARHGAGRENERGEQEIVKFLATKLTRGKKRTKPWAGLAIGVFNHARDENSLPMNASLASLLKAELADCKVPANVGAFAIGAGISRMTEAKELLHAKLDFFSGSDEARGYVALGLGLMGDHTAIEPLQQIVSKSKYRAALLQQVSIALGLLGDKELVPELTSMLRREASSLASQASIAAALGFIGDSRSVTPLVEMLADDRLTAGARGFAAVALGLVADKELLPWNSKIAIDQNYRANTVTLTDGSAGILDIL